MGGLQDFVGSDGFDTIPEDARRVLAEAGVVLGHAREDEIDRVVIVSTEVLRLAGHANFNQHLSNLAYLRREELAMAVRSKAA